MKRSTWLWSALSVGSAFVVCCGGARFAMASSAVVSYVAMCMAVRSARRQSTAVISQPKAAPTLTLVAYASQTGLAEELAAQSVRLLRDERIELKALDEVDVDALDRYRRAFFIVSTTGEGDAPDNAARFLGHAAKPRASKQPMPQYGLLALGDRHYRDFCAFGHRVHAALLECGASPLFDMIEVDNGDPAALRGWNAHLSSVAGGESDAPIPALAPFERWTLTDRTLLNPGSAGDPAYHVCLAPAGSAALSWQAGDIAQIRPRHATQTVRAWLQNTGLDENEPVDCDGEFTSLLEALASRVLPSKETKRNLRTAQSLIDSLDPLPARDYSISSLPPDGRIELLVRQTRLASASANDGVSLGLASGWLTCYASSGCSVELRVRMNRMFHAPPDDRPLILIGAGTGLAGLRAHLKARAQKGHKTNWLIFGERNRAYDGFHADELIGWKNMGLLQRLDCAWSRDHSEGRYVGDVVRAASTMLRDWVGAGASIYLCGSAERMGRSVHEALTEAIGSDRLEALIEAGRYRRDVY